MPKEKQNEGTKRAGSWHSGDHNGVTRFKRPYHFCSVFLPTHTLGRKQTMARVLGSLPATWETQEIELLARGFTVAQVPSYCRHLGERTNR